MILKLKVIDDKGIEQAIPETATLTVKFPSIVGFIEKSSHNGKVKVVNKTEIHVELSQFEADGFKEEVGQSFEMRIFDNGKNHEALFSQCLNVTVKDGHKFIEGAE